MRRLIILAVASLVAACNSTAGIPRLTGGDSVVTGGSFLGRVQMSKWYAIGPYATLGKNCSPESFARVRVLDVPQNGTASIIRKVGTAGFPPENSLAHCNNRRFAGPMVLYTPNPGFLGQDRFTYEVLFKNGERRVISPILDVVPRL